jgi:pyridinium-3,5-bisthiocarboxylic acid mononucleotide nickel chelatase
VPIEKIHFHEVGAVDAIVDVVGACVGFHFLGIERFGCSALNVGGGTVKMAHGILPVPAPATANLLQGKPTYSNGVQKELVTPTGAAIVSTLCDSFGPQPPMSISAIGYGAGTADLEGQPNVVRLMIGEAAEKTAPGFDEEIAVIEANLDDMNPQIYGYFLEKALAAGALDVYTTPVQMKKNRPGTLLTVLCKPQETNSLMSLIFAETTTFGARTYRAQRRTLPREFVSVSTEFGEVRIKVSRVNGRIQHVAPEYEDCRKLAVEKNVPLQRVISDALRRYEGGS